MGAVEKEAILETAYLIRDQVDHLLSPTSRSCTSNSTEPMQIVSFFCSVMLIISLILGCITLYQKIVGTALEGFTTVIIINLFTGSIIMLSLGIIGYYISKIYDEIKGRPKYIVRSTCGELKNTATAPKDVL